MMTTEEMVEHIRISKVVTAFIDQHIDKNRGGITTWDTRLVHEHLWRKGIEMEPRRVACFVEEDAKAREGVTYYKVASHRVYMQSKNGCPLPVPEARRVK